MNCYSPRVVQAVKYLDKFLKEKLISLEELALAFDLEPTRTSLMPNKQPVFVERKAWHHIFLINIILDHLDEKTDMA